MIYRKKFILCCMLLGAISSLMAENVLMSQNFDTNFATGTLKGTAKFATGDYLVMDEAYSMEIVSDAKSAPHALKIGRKGVVGFTTFRSTKAVPAGNDFCVSFYTKIVQN